MAIELKRKQGYYAQITLATLLFASASIQSIRSSRIIDEQISNRINDSINALVEQNEANQTNAKPSDATQCRSMQSNAKQKDTKRCKAMRSNANNATTKRNTMQHIMQHNNETMRVQSKAKQSKGQRCKTMQRKACQFEAQQSDSV